MDAIDVLIAEAQDLARHALDFDGRVSGDTAVSMLPSLVGDGFQGCCAWRSPDGTSYVASTMPMPWMAVSDSAFARYDARGLPETAGGPPPGWRSVPPT